MDGVHSTPDSSPRRVKPCKWPGPDLATLSVSFNITVPYVTVSLPGLVAVTAAHYTAGPILSMVDITSVTVFRPSSRLLPGLLFLRGETWTYTAGLSYIAVLNVGMQY